MTTNNNDIKKEVSGITLKDSKNNELNTKNTSLGISPNHTQTNSDDINVANNVAQRNSQDLTEQWKKGELEIDQCYYVKYADVSVEIQLYVGGFVMRTDNQVVKVLAKVPSYEEWLELKEFADYSLHNRDELTRQINFWMDKHTQIEKENQQLKELLKECREFLIVYQEEDGEIAINDVCTSQMIDKIDEVLE